MSRRGHFIVFEGVEGAGKSTHLRRAAATLRSRGLDVVETAEPGGTALGQEIRRLLVDVHDHPPTAWSELFLYLADRAQHVTSVIAPALANGQVVLCDRFSASTLAYQGYGRGLQLAVLRQLDAIARQGVEPDLIILLDCPVELGLRRAGRDDRFHREALDFHEKVRNGFLALARQEQGRYLLVDTTTPAEQVHAQVLAAIETCLRER